MDSILLANLRVLYLQAGIRTDENICKSDIFWDMLLMFDALEMLCATTSTYLYILSYLMKIIFSHFFLLFCLNSTTGRDRKRLYYMAAYLVGNGDPFSACCYRNDAYLLPKETEGKAARCY